MMNHYKIRIILGLLLFVLLIYNRLFRSRAEKLLQVSFDLWKLVFYSIMFCTMLFFSIKTAIVFAKWLLNKQPKENNIKIVILWKSFVFLISKPIIYLNSTLETFDIYIKNSCPYYNDEKSYVDVMLEYIGTTCVKKAKIVLSVSLFVTILSQSIVLISFIVDIFFWHKFYYFYKVLWLLIIPLIFRYIFYSIRIFAVANLTSLNENIHIHIVHNTQMNLIKNFSMLPRITLEQHALLEKANVSDQSYIYTLAPHLFQENPNISVMAVLSYYKPIISMFCKIYFFTWDWDELNKKYLLLFNSIKYMLYALCWLYLMFLLF